MAGQLLSAEPSAGAAGQLLSAKPEDGVPKPPSALEDFWKAHANIANLARGTLATLPAAGAMAAGVVAAPETGGLGSIPAAAMGAGMGRGLRDLIAEGLDLEPKTSPIVKSAKIALDAGTTAGTAMALRLVGAIVSQPKSALAEFLRRSVSPIKNVTDVADNLTAAPNPQPPVLTRPGWQTWPALPPAIMGRFQSLVDSGKSEAEAIAQLLGQAKK